MAFSLSQISGRVTKKGTIERLIGLALLVLILGLRYIDPAPLQLLRLKTFDIFQQLSPRQVPQPVVMIIDIDEESLNAYGQWPWPRTRIAELIKAAAENGAAAVAFDIIFAEHDRMSPGNIATNLRGLDKALKDRLKALPSNDERMAGAMRNARVILGQSGLSRKVEQWHAAAEKQSQLATVGSDPRPFLFKYPGIVRNVPELEAAALGRGLLTIQPEIDGVVRRVPMIMDVDDKVLPSLTLELLRVATGAGAVLVRTNDAGIDSVVVRGVRVPTDGNGRVWVHFSHSDPKRYVSAKDLLSGTVAGGSLRGKLAIVGTSATGLFDLKSTPVNPVMPGVEVHAQLLETILTNAQLSRPNYAVGAELFLAMFVGLLIISLVPMLGAVTTLVLGFFVSAAISAGAFYLFQNKGVMIDVVYPLLASFVIFSTMIFLNYFREEMQKRQIRGAFGQYLSPALVEQLAKDPDKLVLGGETKDMTILFSDVRGFTTISETYKDNPQGLTALINRLLTPMSEVVANRNGTIDKYMGDCIMAFWNAPLDDGDHAKNACAAALGMQVAVEKLNEQRKAEAEEMGEAFLPISVGVGINTGDCVVGNMGSDLRFDYTVLGDAVNLASRLEGQTKGYGADVIIGARTAELAGSDFAVLPIDKIRVKGKAEPEDVFALIGAREIRSDDEFGQLAGKHGEMISAYRNRKWRMAHNALKACREHAEKFALSGVYDVYAARIRAFQKTPPPKDWDGVYDALSK